MEPSLSIPDFALRVLALVDLVPSGKVLSYQDVAVILGEKGPRQVGSVMAKYGHETNWHRVIYKSGSPPALYERSALERWRSESTPLKNAKQVNMKLARWTPDLSLLNLSSLC